MAEASAEPEAECLRAAPRSGDQQNAVLAFPPGNLATGHAEIRKVYEQFVAAAPVLSPGRTWATEGNNGARSAWAMSWPRRRFATESSFR
jgi:hypothetical protein